jgi:hypothetical protein
MAEYRAAAAQHVGRPISKAGAMFIVAIWAIILALFLWAIWPLLTRA